MSHVGLNPQSLVFSHQGLPLRVVVETGVPGRSKIIRDLRSGGAEISTAPEDANILIIDPETSGGTNWLEDWDGHKLILEYRWVHESTKAGRALLDADDFGGKQLGEAGPTGVALLTPRTTPSDSSGYDNPSDGARRTHVPQTNTTSGPPFMGVSMPGPAPQVLQASQHTQPSMPFPIPTQTSQAPSANGPTSLYQPNTSMYPMAGTFPQISQIMPQGTGFSPEAMALAMTQMAMFQAMAGGMGMAYNGQPMPGNPYYLNPMWMNQSTPMAPPGTQDQHQTFPPATPVSTHSDTQRSSVSVKAERSPSQPAESPSSYSMPTARSQRGRGKARALPRKRAKESRSPTPSSGEDDMDARPPPRKRASLGSSISGSRDKRIVPDVPRSSSPWGGKIENWTSPTISTAPAGMPASSNGQAIFEKRPRVPLKIWVQFDGFKGRKQITAAIKAGKGLIVQQVKDGDYIVLCRKAKSFEDQRRIVMASRRAKTPMVAPEFILESAAAGALLSGIDYAIEEPKPERRATTQAKRESIATAKAKQFAVSTAKEQPAISRGSTPPLPESGPVEMEVAHRHVFKFTADEQKWAAQYMQVLFCREPDASHAYIYRCLHEKMPHHSLPSWQSHLQRGDGALERARQGGKKLRRQLAESSEHPQMEASDDETLTQAHLLGPERTHDDHTAKFAEDEMTELLPNHKPERLSSAPHEREKSQDEREDIALLVECLASVDLTKVDDAVVWDMLDAKRPCRTAPSWLELYERREEEVIRFVNERMQALTSHSGSEGQ